MNIEWLKQLDELLRGERVRRELLLAGKIDLPLKKFVLIAAGLGALYGFFMGWYALFGRRDGAALQVFAATVKLPALFLLTLGVTFPSLYVFNALVGCRMSFATTMRVLVAAIVVNLAIAASLGPILAFFTLSTTSYAFMVLLNVALLGIAGLVSVGFLLRSLRTLARSRVGEETAAGIASPGAPLPEPLVQREETSAAGEELEPTPAPDDVGARARQFVGAATVRREYSEVARREGAADLILSIWVFIYAVVGMQMGWILRPFIGSPDAAFEWFRSREGSFFQAVSGALWRLLGG